MWQKVPLTNSVKRAKEWLGEAKESVRSSMCYLCFIGGRVAFLLMCSKSFALLVKRLSDFLIVLIKPVFMWGCISAELRECSMVHRIYSESYQVFDCCSLCRRQCLSNFRTKSPLLVVFACGRRLDRICMLSFGRSSSLRCTAYHFCWL